MKKMNDKMHSKQYQMTLCLWVDEGGAIEKIGNIDTYGQHQETDGFWTIDTTDSMATAGRGGRIDMSRSVSGAIARSIDKPEESLLQLLTVGILPKASKGSPFFSRRSSWA